MTNNQILKWVWHKQPTLLENLDESQLKSIKNSIDKSKNKVWFGVTSETWKEKINETLEDKRITVLRLRQQRVRRAVQNANIITYGILKCFK